MEGKLNRFFVSLSKSEWENFLNLNKNYYNDLNNMRIFDYPSPYYDKGIQCVVPYRLGYHSSEEFKYTCKVEQIIGWCLMTRHQNGFIRFSYLRKILDKQIIADYPFVTPYILRLLGEYVSEIWDYIFENQYLLHCKEVNSFVINNFDFMDLNLQRNISYSYLYYRSNIVTDKFVSNGCAVLQNLLRCASS